jgi:hypothetical protein
MLQLPTQRSSQKVSVILTYEGHHTSFVQRGLTIGFALFIVSAIVVYIMAIGFALVMYSELFTNSLSVLNLIYSASGELVNLDWDFFFTPFIMLCSTL